jgi:excisionase family DNA binding protein
VNNTQLEIPSRKEPRRLLTGDEVADLLNISRSFAFALMKRGEIPTVKLGRAVRVRPQDLEEFIALSVRRNENRFVT